MLLCFTIFCFLIESWAQNSTVAPGGMRQLKVALMMPVNMSDASVESNIGFYRSAGAVTIALERIQLENLLPNTNFTFVWYFDECVGSLGSGYTVEAAYVDKADVLIGPACPTPVIYSGTVAAFYNFPIFIWGTIMPSDINDGTRFPTLASTSVTTLSITLTLMEFLIRFQWNEFAFIYAIRRSDLIPKCSYLASDIDNAVTNEDNMTMTYKRNIANDSYEILKEKLVGLKKLARIILVCFESLSDRRTFMMAMSELGMITDDYLVVFIETDRTGFFPSGGGMWVDRNVPPDGKDDIALKAFENAIILDLQPYNLSFDTFNQEVIANIEKWPFYCVGCIDKSLNASSRAPNLADTFYLYASSLNKTIAQYGESAKNDGTTISNMAKGEYN
uniref:Receptor ligand binding region domain-containing protein n=1 Tax=Acrobeloides nanus TaxID=290746 RepID=A0A914E2D4_9BILA